MNRGPRPMRKGGKESLINWRFTKAMAGEYNTDRDT